MLSDESILNTKRVRIEMISKSMISGILICSIFLIDINVGAIEKKESNQLKDKFGCDTTSFDPYMGDWEGNYSNGDKVVAQVIALGNGKYRANILPEFDKRYSDDEIVVMDGNKTDDKVVFSSGEWLCQIGDNSFIGVMEGDKKLEFLMKKVVRLSPTLNLKPPKEGFALFNGTNLDMWETEAGKPASWKIAEDGSMEVSYKAGSIRTKMKFRSLKLHIEFRTPLMPEKRGQERGNSGVYLQESYEVQVLDSYGLEGLHNECGGIYKIAQPLVNMCAPPGQWQTYDITYFSPKYDKNGLKLSNAVVTVVHNGVTIHEKQEIPHPTGGGKSKGDFSEPGSLILQDHGNPVQYRNIWMVELCED